MVFIQPPPLTMDTAWDTMCAFHKLVVSAGSEIQSPLATSCERKFHGIFPGFDIVPMSAMAGFENHCSDLIIRSYCP